MVNKETHWRKFLSAAIRSQTNVGDKVSGTLFEVPFSGTVRVVECGTMGGIWVDLDEGFVFRDEGYNEIFINLSPLSGFPLEDLEAFTIL